MTEFKKALKNFFLYGALYNTVISLPFILYAVVNSSGAAPNVCQTCGVETGAVHLAGDRLLSIMMLAFIMAAGTAVIHIAGISKTVAIITHAACFNVGFLIFMAVCGSGFSKSVIATVIFAVIYVIERVVQSAISKAIKKNSKPAAKSAKAPTKNDKNEKKLYTSQFS